MPGGWSCLRFAGVLAAAVVLATSCASDVHASFILPPAVGVPDLQLDGAAVAEPLTPEGAMFQNPAGLVGFERKMISAGLGASFAEDQIVSEETGYAETDDVLVWVPSGGISVPFAERWRFGVSVHGSAGASFDFPAKPPGLPNGFFTESALVGMPFALAYELRRDLWLGAELEPLFGYLRNRFALPDPAGGAAVPIKYSLRGFGVQAMVGATWLPNRTWSLGLGIRAPGAIWMDGSTPIAGERNDVNLKVRMPTQIFAGITNHVTRRLDLSLGARWTDSSTFGDSDITFAGISLPFVPDGKDEWRIAGGVSFDATDRLALRAGASYATTVVGNEGISPALFDTEDVKISAGFSWRSGAWVLHTMAGYAFDIERNVESDKALVIVGDYRGRAVLVMLGVTWEAR